MVSTVDAFFLNIKERTKSKCKAGTKMVIKSIIGPELLVESEGVLYLINRSLSHKV